MSQGGNHRTLTPETWKALENVRAIRDVAGPRGDCVGHLAFGLVLMAVLARHCAGTRKHTITDQSDAYLSWARQFQRLSELGDQGGLSSDQRAGLPKWLGALSDKQSQDRQADEVRRSLVTITLDMVDASTLEVEDLVALKTKKKRLASTLRKNYSAAIEKVVADLSKPGITATDVATSQQEFREQVAEDQ